MGSNLEVMGDTPMALLLSGASPRRRGIVGGNEARASASPSPLWCPHQYLLGPHHPHQVLFCPNPRRSFVQMRPVSSFEDRFRRHSPRISHRAGNAQMRDYRISVARVWSRRESVRWLGVGTSLDVAKFAPSHGAYKFAARTLR